MWHTVTCSKCGSVLKYDDRSVCLGNRDREDVQCPECGNVLTSVFTDQIPQVMLIEKGNAEKK